MEVDAEEPGADPAADQLAAAPAARGATSAMLAHLSEQEVQALAAAALGPGGAALLAAIQRSNGSWFKRVGGQLFHCVSHLLAREDALMELADEAALWAYLCDEAHRDSCLLLKALLVTANLTKDNVKVWELRMTKVVVLAAAAEIGLRVTLWPVTTLFCW